MDRNQLMKLTKEALVERVLRMQQDQVSKQQACQDEIQALTERLKQEQQSRGFLLIANQDKLQLLRCYHQALLGLQSYAAACGESGKYHYPQWNLINEALGRLCADMEDDLLDEEEVKR
jgi:hypothetical protein